MNSMKHVAIEIWYSHPGFPDLAQCLSWITVDSAPDYTRAQSFMKSVIAIPGSELIEWLIREIDPPVQPNHEGSFAIH